jgi:DNA-binding CsgD family transcriptional regulator
MPAAKEWSESLMDRRVLELPGVRHVVEVPLSISRRVEVQLTTGQVAVLHGHSSTVARHLGTLVTVLELQSEHRPIASSLLATPSAREADVAALIADGFSDPAIADRLFLSHHTVSQYARRIYRKPRGRLPSRAYASAPGRSRSPPAARV